MSDFICNKCNKKFKQKNNLKYHLINKVCTGGISNKTKNNKCTFCNKLFTTKTSMYRHVKHNCKVKQNEDKKKDEIFKKLLELEEQNKQIKKDNILLKKKVRKLEKTACSKIINNNNGVINNGPVINANINLVAYGTENMDKFDEKDIIKILKQGYHSTIKLTELVHFNPKYPEFHNIYITNMKDKYAMMYDGTNWTLTMKDDLINRIYDDKKNYIEENVEDFVNSLSDSRKKALDRWANTEETDKKIIRIKERIKLLLYNSKNIPINTQKTIDNINILVKHNNKCID